MGYLPFPQYQKKSATYQTKQLICKPFTLHLKDLEHPYYNSINPIFKPDTFTLDNLSDIYEVNVSKLTQDFIEIRVHCT